MQKQTKPGRWTGAQPTDVLVMASEPGRPALVALRRPAPRKWRVRVAKAIGRARVVFAWPGRDRLRVVCVSGGRESPATAGEAAIARKVARHRAPRSVRCIDGVLPPDALAAAMKKENSATLRAVVRSLRSNTGLIPFVGAGMSTDYGAPMWGAFLELAAESAADKKAVAEHVRRSEFELAAQRLDTGRSRKRFRELVKQRLDVNVPVERLHSGPLSLLPLLTKGPVITTNFDRLLEAFYSAAEQPFEQEHWIANAREQGDRILEAIQQNAHALVKLHGDVREPKTFTFTAFEYEQSYGDAKGKRGVLSQLGNVIYTNRPLLFLGCSLESDRTLQVLTEVVAQNPRLKSYAVLAAKELVSAREARRVALERCGIVPLWYAPERYEQIETLLKKLLELYSVEDVSDADRTGSKVPPEPFAKRNLRGWFRPPGLLNKSPDPAHVKEVANWVARGEVVFFLGSRVNNTQLLGNRFYTELAGRLGVLPADRNRADVVEVAAANARRGDLAEAIEDLLETHLAGPWYVHHLITSLAARKPREDVASPVVVVTTNYDDVLERSLAGAQMPYHLFLYQPNGRFAGRFVHRSPAGRLCVIHNPDGVLALNEPGAVVVKMNGGLDPRRELMSRFVVGSRDFVELAARIPAVFPAVVRSYLARPLLFLGHGLAEEDTREFARYAFSRRQGAPSWAVQLGRRDVDYWRDTRGVDIQEADVDAYVCRVSEVLLSDHKIET